MCNVGGSGVVFVAIIIVIAIILDNPFSCYYKKKTNCSDFGRRTIAEPPPQSFHWPTSEIYVHLCIRS